ncbi:MAG: hypothetical protein RIS47_686 [Bacteroidota bacterium]|jgi:phage shock protein A
MNIFTRIFKIFQSEAHSVVDQLEDPIKLTEQGIRDLKTDLDSSLKAMAEVKALAIRTKRDAETFKNQISEYEQKAMALLRKAERGEIAPEEADRLAEAALTKRTEAEENFKRATADGLKFEQNAQKLDVSVKKLRSMVSKYENELKTLKARATVSSATKKVNKQLASIDSSSTVSMLERMKEKVEQNEAESEAYAEIANESRSVDDEIEKALGSSSAGSSDALAALKARMSPNRAIDASPASSVGSGSALNNLKSKLNEETELRSDRLDEA